MFTTIAIGLGIILGILASVLRFTTVKEGTAKVVFKGDSFHKILMSYEGYHMTGEWDVQKNGSFFTSPLQSFFGLYFVGFWPIHKIYTYNFEWAEMKQNKAGVYEVNHREAPTNFIYVKDFPYVGILDAAETKGGLPVDVRYVATIRVTNPYRALFKVDGWLGRTIAAVNSANRSFIGTKEFAELTSDNEEKEVIKVEISLLNQKLADYGVEIVKLETQAIDISGKAGEKAREATTLAYVAERQKVAGITKAEENKQVAITEAEGKAEATIKIANAEATARKIRAVSFKDYETEADIDPTDAMRLETMQSVGENGNLVVTGEGANVLISREGGKK